MADRGTNTLDVNPLATDGACGIRVDDMQSSARRYQLLCRGTTFVCATAMALPSLAAERWRSGWEPAYAVTSAAGLLAPPIPGVAARRVDVGHPQGPMARLVRNSDMSDGAPPYALTDQKGTIQRLVEPTPGIDLAPYVGMVVALRHDTGRTLLASQLDLPPLSLAIPGGPAVFTTRDRPTDELQPVQYMLDDSATVELLPDDAEWYDDAPTPQVVDPSDSGHHIVSDDPAMGALVFLHEFPHGSELGLEYCPECDELHYPPVCGPAADTRGLPVMRKLGLAECRPYAEVDLQFLRIHFPEGGVGKLAEKYDFSPRFVLGFEGIGAVDARLRFWTYGRDTRLLNGGLVRFEFDVLDFEAAHRFRVQRLDMLFAAGFRLAKIDLVDADGDAVGATLKGATMAADGRAHICDVSQGRFAGVFGGRWSILGGDWGGNAGGDFLSPERDDNVLVSELYAGIELAGQYEGVDVSARLTFEMQHWHSDVLARNGTADSIGVLGPGIRLGARF